ncbi:MAG: sigma-54-dependent Fis family transcriptional regulator [Deltaproteobacteria bacterium]|nr:sigma-54-dependent Fis family transcriptional regulator [Deltaproteobacteria bacterium]
MPLDIDLSRFPVLVVDDEQDNLDVIRFNFKKSHPLTFARSGPEALEALKDLDCACIVSDQRMPGMTGLEFLREARKLRPDTVNVLLTAYADLPVLVEALNEGLVYRYVSKPFSTEDLGHALRGAIERFHLLRENRRLVEQLKAQNQYLEAEVSSRFDTGGIVGGAPALKAVLEQVRQVAPTASTVLLRGESGTGKELLARAIHLSSPRTKGPFVKVNCAALAPGVLESELFGHEKGSFTGALARKLGRFELADGGTLFLDEVGDLSMEIQVKLLRVLQEREFERVGGTETIKTDVRLVSATNKDLEKAIAAKEFREDLYYRLNVFPIYVPPLRERAEDIEPLAESFVARYSKSAGKKVGGVSDGALDKLLAYPWPGNVRELENVVERAVILAKGALLEADDLDFGRRLQTLSVMLPASATDLPGQLEEIEKRRLVEAMSKHKGRKSDVARELGINRSTLYYRLKKFGLDAEAAE